MEVLTFVELDVTLDVTPYTFRFSFPDSVVRHDSIPALRDVSVTPTVVDPGRSIGQRGSVSVSFSDFLYPLADTAADSGTFFGKLRARRRSLQGCALRVLRGEVGDELADMVTEHYAVEALTRSSGDSVTIVAKDLLKLASGDRAQAPRVSRGRVLTGIDDNDLSVTLTPTGIGDAEYPASGKVAIGGSEICSFTRSGDVLTITRAQSNTPAKEHEADELVQLVLEYSAESPADIVYDLLDSYTDIDSAWMPLAEWQADIDGYIGRLYSAEIAQPTDVDDLLNELIEQAGMVMYWDAVGRKVRLKSLRPVTGSRTIGTDEAMADSFGFREQPEKRISRVWTYFALTNPLAKLDDEQNYRSTLITIDTDAEDPSEYGQAAVYKVYSRWIAINNRTAAARLNSQLLSRYRDPPRKFELDLFKASSEAPALAQGLSLEHWSLQNEDGEVEAAAAQVTALSQTEDRWQLTLEEMLFADVSDVDDGGEPGGGGAGGDERTIVIDTDTMNVNLRTLHDSFYVPADSDTVLICIVDEGATVGSSSAETPAFDVGSWPVGVDITIQVRGRIQGAGGNGGAGGAEFASHPEDNVSTENGQDGGVALYTRYAITLDNDGEIYGGGGGGHGGTGFEAYGGGGGGGAGTVPGTGAYLDGQPGTTEAGGAGGAPGGGSWPGGTGGGPGQNGSLGANAGAAIDGDSFVTYTTVGTISGPQIN